MNRDAAPPASGWDCHVHVFDADAPVRPGHYRPVHRPLADIEALAAAQGVGHLVLVQPSVYGSDNGVMLRALRQGGGRHRGVAVLGADVDNTELDRLHAAGVRGVRYNLVSPAGHAALPTSDITHLAPRLAERGWHVQWYVPASLLPQLLPLQRRCPVPFVLDHLAGLHAAVAVDDPAWQAAAALAAGGAWVKLSGWYRLQAHEPYDTLAPALRRVAALFGTRCVWGSDWPHTSFAPDALPAYGSTLQPLSAHLGPADRASILGPQARALYDTP